ncbi:MAG: 5-oxoprolinase subunit PxpB [Chloroflexota bacterium]
MEELDIRPAGDSAVLVALGDRIDPELNGRVHLLTWQVRQALKHFAWVEVVPSYSTLLVRYDPGVLDYDTVVDAIRGAESANQVEGKSRRRFVIPVAYGGNFGMDLEEVARLHDLNSQQVVERHAGRDYPIYGLGFSPGFPFLGGLDESLHTPRLETPRPRVPAGSVAIGGEQTGVYPTSTPGGWRLIGRTPLILFDVGQSLPVPYQPGDLLHFEPIDAEEYERLKADPHMPWSALIEK